MRWFLRLTAVSPRLRGGGGASGALRKDAPTRKKPKRNTCKSTHEITSRVTALRAHFVKKKRRSLGALAGTFPTQSLLVMGHMKRQFSPTPAPTYK